MIGRERPEESSGPTLFLPHRSALESGATRDARSLPPDLRNQVARRLRVIAITYSLAFFFADLFPPLVTGEMGRAFPTGASWAPALISIALGFTVAVLASRLSWANTLNMGLVFEVAGSYGIALSQYLVLPDIAAQPLVLYAISPSWVAVWMIVYSIAVPAPPRKALLALIASASAPPLVIGLKLRNAGLSHLLPAPAFFFSQVFPYMICVALAYVGVRIVYALGARVARERELGSYHLIERLGGGGMGEVWRASHRMLARPAAIKFIRAEAISAANPEDSKTMLSRFELEAQATASLSSVHTVDLYDFGVTDDGTFYYVMELLEGLDCESLIRRFGPLPPGRVVYLVTQVCESLEEAHDKGLIHRDVKPANIYVCRSGTRCDFVKVLDFGLVTHRRAPATPEPRLTSPQQAVGTPQYMPPEVALGKDIDGRADLYGLGCVAYWLATGRSVFEGSTPYEIISKHLHTSPDPPSLHAPNRVPPELDALILRCLEKSPEQRPANARDLARELGAIPLSEPWRDEHAAAWWKKHASGTEEHPQEHRTGPHVPPPRG